MIGSYPQDVDAAADRQVSDFGASAFSLPLPAHVVDLPVVGCLGDFYLLRGCTVFPVELARGSIS